MKKSVFTLLAIATIVVSMSSCSQNDGGSSNDLNLQQTTTSTEKQAQSDLKFVLCASSDQMACIDMQFVFDVNGQEKTINASQMSEESDAVSKELVTNTDQLVKAFDEIGSTVDMKVLCYNFGKVLKSDCKFKGIKWTPKVGRNVKEEVNLVCAYGFMNESKFGNYYSASGIYKGVPSDDKTLTDFCNITANAALESFSH